MDIKRIILLFKKIRFYLIIDGNKRAQYIKKQNLLKGIGENCLWQSRIFPMDPEMILIHDNVSIAADVLLCTHDAIRHVLHYLDDEYYIPHIGCIEIEDNVFIGAGSIIMPNVRIGYNTIIAAGSIVTKDIPPGSIVGGVPARIIGSFDDLLLERKKETQIYKSFNYKELCDIKWEEFFNTRDRIIKNEI